MSANEKKIEVAAGAEIVRFCPYEDCHAKFSEPIASLVWHKCPECERDFKVSVR